MRHFLELYFSILLRRYPDDGVREPLSESDLSNADMKLVLVVKNAKKGWLVPFEDADTAIRQTHENRYDGNLLLVGINYDKGVKGADAKKHIMWPQYY